MKEIEKGPAQRMTGAYSADGGAEINTDSRPEARPRAARGFSLAEWAQPLPGVVCSQVARCGGVGVEGGASGVKVFRQDLSEKGRSQPHKGECVVVCVNV